MPPSFGPPKVSIVRTSFGRVRAVLVTVATAFVLTVSSGLVAAGPGGAPGAAASAGAEADSAVAPVRLHDATAFVVRKAHGTKSADARARAASKNLEEALKSGASEDVRVELREDVAVVYAGETPVVQLYPHDAAAAGDASLKVHADAVAAGVREVLRSEHRRGAIANVVFSISLVVFFALVALYVARKIGEFGRRSREWVHAHPERLPGIRIQSVEVLGPTAVRAAILAVLVLGRWVGQAGVVYFWLVSSLSLFDATRAYTERLTAFLLQPLSGLATRLVVALPLLFVALVAAAFTYGVARFIRLFFDGVARGETTLAWLSRDLAHPTSVLLQVGVVIAALVFAGPVVSGDPDGALARVGIVLLVTVGVAVVPLAAAGAVGLTQVYGRRIAVGETVKIGSHEGRVVDVGLLEVRLQSDDGADLRVPNLLTLVNATRHLEAASRRSLEVIVDPSVDYPTVQGVLLEAAARVGSGPLAELIDLSADGARYRVSVSAAPHGGGELGSAVAHALSAAEIRLGRAPRSERDV